LGDQYFPAARGHGDHRIEISVEAVDGARDTADVRLGEIALEWRRLDRRNRQRGEDLPVGAERVAIDGERGSAVVFDRSSERFDGRRWLRTGETSSVETARRCLGPSVWLSSFVRP
jgi:hypothetical protein